MIYLDTSALVKLYVLEPGSEFVQSCVSGQDEPLPVWELQEAELANALHLKVFRNEWTEEEAERQLGHYQARKRRGIYTFPEIDRVELIREFHRLSRETPRTGCRTMDIFHMNPLRPRAFGGKGAEGIKREFLAIILMLFGLAMHLCIDDAIAEVDVSPRSGLVHNTVLGFTGDFTCEFIVKPQYELTGENRRFQPLERKFTFFKSGNRYRVSCEIISAGSEQDFFIYAFDGRNFYFKNFWDKSFHVGSSEADFERFTIAAMGNLPCFFPLKIDPSANFVSASELNGFKAASPDGLVTYHFESEKLEYQLGGVSIPRETKINAKFGENFDKVDKINSISVKVTSFSTSAPNDSEFYKIPAEPPPTPGLRREGSRGD